MSSLLVGGVAEIPLIIRVEDAPPSGTTGASIAGRDVVPLDPTEVVRIHGLVTEAPPFSDETQFITRGMEQDERTEILEEFAAIPKHDKQNVITAAREFITDEMSCAERLAVIRNFALIPHEHRAAIAERMPHMLKTEATFASWKTITTQLIDRQVLCFNGTYAIAASMSDGNACAQLLEGLSRIRHIVHRSCLINTLALIPAEDRLAAVDFVDSNTWRGDRNQPLSALQVLSTIPVDARKKSMNWVFPEFAAKENMFEQFRLGLSSGDFNNKIALLGSIGDIPPEEDQQELCRQVLEVMTELKATIAQIRETIEALSDIDPEKRTAIIQVALAMFDAQMSATARIDLIQAIAETPKFVRQAAVEHNEAGNRAYLERMHVYADLPDALKAATPLNRRALFLVAKYVGLDCLSPKSIYSIVPELVDLAFPFQLSGTTPTGDTQLIQKCKVGDSGQMGMVQFVHFEKDPLVNRLFAIKQPSPAFRNTHQEASNARALTDYNNTLNMSLIIGKHPNFMNVRGIVFKKSTGGQPAPYLILDYIDGDRLYDIRKNLSDPQKVELLSQLKSALTHLLELGIMPQDAHAGNFLVTKDNVLKMIDFDPWIYGSRMSLNLAQHLYGIAGEIAKTLGNEPRPFAYAGGDIKQALEQQLEANVIKPFRSL